MEESADNILNIASDGSAVEAIRHPVEEIQFSFFMNPASDCSRSLHVSGLELRNILQCGLP